MIIHYFIVYSLDLDAWINDPPPSSSSDDEDYSREDNSIFINVVGNKFAPSAIPEPTEEELEMVMQINLKF